MVLVSAKETEELNTFASLADRVVEVSASSISSLGNILVAICLVPLHPVRQKNFAGFTPVLPRRQLSVTCLVLGVQETGRPVPDGGQCLRLFP
uniref:Uncharacterized protein n=1 Tax=Amphimedon queenslandica TaxID=400682 RepID=A0A1X7V1A7_AMPQE